MRRLNTIRLVRPWCSTSVVCLLLLSQPLISKADDPNQAVIKQIIVGVAHNDGLISRLSFDYTVDYNASEQWRNARLQSIRRRNPHLPEVPRSFMVERAIRTGTARFEGKKLLTTSKVVAVSDGKTLADEVVSYDGSTSAFTQLNLIENRADVFACLVPSDFYDVRKCALRFTDDEPFYTWLTDPNAELKYVETENLDGTKCYVVERARDYVTPDETPITSRRRCWIAPDKGFLVKKAIVFDSRSPDRRVLTVTDCNLTEVSKGIWYYSKVRFESYPYFLPKPDIVDVLEIRNIVVGQPFEKDAFKVRFPAGCLVNDEISGKRYRVGQNGDGPEVVGD